VTSQQGQAEFSDALRLGNHQSAGEWLVRRFAPEVFGLCLAIVQDRPQAEDLSQEVFASAFAALGGFRGEASARTWLLKIARNRCIDHLRKRKRWSGLDDDGDPDEIAEEVSLPNTILSRRSDIELALVGLEEVERALIVLRFSHGLDYEELAAAFGLKSGTTRMRVSRALGKMRDFLSAPVRAANARAALGQEDEAFDEDTARSPVAVISQSRQKTAPYQAEEGDEQSLPPAASPAAAPPAAGSAPPPLPARRAPSAPPGGLPPPQSAPAPSRPSLAAAPPPAPGVPGSAAPPAGAARHALGVYFESEEAWLSIDLQVRLRDMTEGLRTS
jgi:RNA polymerase sigma-70 factor (ECF subfamily)